MRVHFIVDSGQRALGAMFTKNLNHEMLVFFYPRSAPRTFHTFFCPPIKIIALDEEGEVIFEEVVTKWRFVHLPACKYVIETAPQVDIEPYMESILSYTDPPFPQYGAVQQGVDLQALLFALLSEAVADMRRIRDTQGYEIRSEIQRDKFDLWERGQMVSSAGFLLDFSGAVNLPSGAVRLSREVLEVEAPHMDELLAASVAGIPWRHEFPNDCMRCGKPGSWRSVLGAPQHAPLEVTWRYLRPENAVPLCHHCAETLNFLRDEALRIDLVWGLWGPRFEALWAWHKALTEERLPTWDTNSHPLWPREFGGSTWETGSGALDCAEPRPPHGVARREQHETALRRALYSKPFRRRQPGEAPLQRLLDFRIDIPDGGEA
jgi:hypothetical protein